MRSSPGTSRKTVSSKIASTVRVSFSKRRAGTRTRPVPTGRSVAFGAGAGAGFGTATGAGAQAVQTASSASPQAGPRMRAFLAGQQAHSLARTGDRAGALAMLRAAEVAMEQAESKAKAHGSYDPASLAYHVAQVNHELGDREGAIRALQHSETVRPAVYRRARVRHRAMLAEWQVEAGRVEEALQNWHLALDDYPLVQSGRADDRFRAMAVAVRPHGRNPHVRELLERARPMAGARRG